MDSSLLKQAILSSSVDLAASGMLSRDVVKHDHFVCSEVILIPRVCNSLRMNLPVLVSVETLVSLVSGL